MSQTKSGKSVWVIGCIVLIVFMLMALCITAIAVAIAIPSFLGARNEAERSEAETALRNASVGGEIYRVDNNGSYSGLRASDLMDFTDKPKVVDGTPGTGEVGLSDVTDDSYVLTYKSAGGRKYKATITNGSIEFDFKSTGKTGNTGSTSPPSELPST